MPNSTDFGRAASRPTGAYDRVGMADRLISSPGSGSCRVLCIRFTSKEVSDMNRLAERLGYLWQRYVAWHDPRPFKREP